MSDFQKIAATTELANGHMKTFWVQGKAIALANVDGEYFAIDDICTHEQCSLGTDGALDGNILICGCHGGMYDVTTGSVIAPPPPAPVQSYETKIDGENILVKLQ